ncbi:MAG: menaquinone biosynthetic enzyme MqnA/MqnD family protein [Planctomycetota bacterium]
MNVTAPEPSPNAGFRLPPPSSGAPPAVRVGVVSFVNTLPLIDGLHGCRDIDLRAAVPSRLLDRLLDGEVEAALCSSIDFQRSPVPMVILPVGRLGCDGPTMTVRLYARTPIDRIDRVHCDTDSHTSVALLRILLDRQYGIRPEFVDFDAASLTTAGAGDWPDAMLLIGDKVVTDSPPAVRYPHQLDLGAAWHDLTGLPFTFAVWMARADTPADRLRLASVILDRQRRRNHPLLDRIVHDAAVPRGWPADLAREYLGRRLRYEWSADAAAGLEAFWTAAAEMGLIEGRRPTQVLDLHAAPAPRTSP